MTLSELLVAPFAEFAFMRRAMVAGIALAVGGGPLGVMLQLRRMSLVGDAMSHAVLPGAAIGFVIAGLSLPVMGAGGFVAGLIVAALSGLVSRFTALREDASFAAFYLISLALGVLIISLHGGGNVDIMHVLFGSVLAVDDTALLLVVGITSLTVVMLAVILRPLVLDCVDPDFLRTVSGQGGFYHQVFLLLVVANLVAAFLALGTLMAVGLMMLPAAAARFWARGLAGAAALASAIGIVASVAGLILSYHLDFASGPAIVLVAGVIYALSLTVGRYGSLRANLLPPRHRAA